MPGWLSCHRWLALAAGPLVFLAAGTAIALNHQALLAPAGASLPAAATPFGDYMLCLYADPLDPLHQLIGTSKGLYATRDNGARWEQIQTTPPAGQVIALAGDAAALYMASRTAGVWRSLDAGRTWRAIALPPEATPLQGLVVVQSRVEVLAATGLYRWDEPNWTRLITHSPTQEAPGRALLRLVYNLHDGTFWGLAGVWVTDLTALAILLLMVTGYRAWYLRWRTSR